MIITKLKQFMDIEEAEKEFIIKEIYDLKHFKPTPKRGKYKLYIETLLIKLLREEGGRKVTYTYRELFEKLGIVNEKYKGGTYRYYYDCCGRIYDSLYASKFNPIYDNVYDIYGYILMSIDWFFKIVPSKLKGIINQVVKAGVESKYWTFEKSTRLFSYEVIEIDDKGKEKKKWYSHDCTREEYLKIEQMKKEILKEMGFKTINQLIYLRGSYDEYQAEIKKYIYKEYGYTDYANTLILQLDVEGKNKELLLPNCRYQLNNKIIEGLKAEKAINNRIKEEIRDECINFYIAL